MSTILDNAKAHYKSQLSGELKSIYIEEWDQTIYFKPAVTMAQQSKVIELHNKGKLSEALIETMMVRCLNEEGKRLFAFGDKDALMNQVDPQVIIKICTIINESTEDTNSLGN